MSSSEKHKIPRVVHEFYGSMAYLLEWWRDSLNKQRLIFHLRKLNMRRVTSSVALTPFSFEGPLKRKRVGANQPAI